MRSTPQKLKEIWKSASKTYYHKNREKILERQKAQHKESYNPEKRKLQNLRRKDKIQESARIYRESNLERCKAWCREWQSKNLDKCRMHNLKRRAVEKNADGTFSWAEWEQIVRDFNGKCAHCRKETKLTIDHKIPLSKGGSNFITNIQPLCRSCNSKKKDKIYA